jgi:hypothetical protein
MEGDILLLAVKHIFYKPAQHASTSQQEEQLCLARNHKKKLPRPLYPWPPPHLYGKSKNRRIRRRHNKSKATLCTQICTTWFVHPRNKMKVDGEFKARVHNRGERNKKQRNNMR